MPELIPLTIDGQDLEVPQGTRVIVAAEQLGIDIPRFCYHPALAVLGACRVCLVRVELPVIDRATGQPQIDPESGAPVYRPMPTLQTSCTLEVAKGMRVYTDTPDVLEARERIIEFLLASHPLDCPVCDKGGECLLQEMTMACGPGRQVCTEPRTVRDKARPIGGGIVLDQERCITCFRCTRFLSEWADLEAWTFSDRGHGNEIEPCFGTPLETARFVGNTIELCPTGALTSAAYRFSARPWELADAPGICPLCPVGCNMTFGGRLGTLCRVTPRQNSMLNDRWICDRGRFGVHWVNGERLAEPTARVGSTAAPAEWVDALERATAILRGAKRPLIVLDPDTCCESGFLAQRLGAALPGAQVDVDDAFDAAGPFQGSLAQVAFSEVVLTVGADLLEDFPVLWMRLARRARIGRQRMISADSAGRAADQKKLAWRACDLAVGSEGSFLEALLRSLRSPERAEEESRALGLAPNALGEIVEAIRGAKSVSVIGGESALGSAARLEALVEEIAKMKGRAVPHGFVLPGANSRGLRVVGCAGGAWRESIREGKADALLLVGGRALEGASEDLSARVGTLPAVVIGARPGEAWRRAEVVLPAASFQEQEQTLANFEGRLQLSLPTNEPIAATLPDWEILALLGERLGLRPLVATAASVRAEMAAAGLGAFGADIPAEGVMVDG